MTKLKAYSDSPNSDPRQRSEHVLMVVRELEARLRERSEEQLRELRGAIDSLRETDRNIVRHREHADQRLLELERRVWTLQLRAAGLGAAALSAVGALLRALGWI